MNEQEATRKAAVLRYLDEQTARAYDEALGKIGQRTEEAELRRFQDEHHRHVEEWDKAGASRDVSDDVMRMVEEHVDLVANAEDPGRTMEALRLLEGANASEYGQAMDADMQQWGDFALRNYEDEKRHCTYIEEHMPQMVGINKAAREAPTTHGAGGPGMYGPTGDIFTGPDRGPQPPNATEQALGERPSGETAPEPKEDEEKGRDVQQPFRRGGKDRE